MSEAPPSAETPRLDCVVDASVATRLFIQENGSSEADRLFAGLSLEPPAFMAVPDLFFSEVAGVLWKYTRNYVLSPADARQDVLDLLCLGLHSYSTADLLQPALELSLSLKIPISEACYAALAQELDLPLVTADPQLVRTLQATRIKVRLLG
jgi:predicted nucleic acid-binding protein